MLRTRVSHSRQRRFWAASISSVCTEVSLPRLRVLETDTRSSTWSKPNDPEAAASRTWRKCWQAWRAVVACRWHASEGRLAWRASQPPTLSPRSVIVALVRSAWAIALASATCRAEAAAHRSISDANTSESAMDSTSTAAAWPARAASSANGESGSAVVARAVAVDIETRPPSDRSQRRDRTGKQLSTPAQRAGPERFRRGSKHSSSNNQPKPTL